jgi:hypothetical protein
LLLVGRGGHLTQFNKCGDGGTKRNPTSACEGRGCGIANFGTEEISWLRLVSSEGNR